MLTNPYDFYVGVPISYLLTLVGAFSVIVQLHQLIVYRTSQQQQPSAAAQGFITFKQWSNDDGEVHTTILSLLPHFDPESAQH